MRSYSVTYIKDKTYEDMVRLAGSEVLLKRDLAR